MSIAAIPEIVTKDRAGEDLRVVWYENDEDTKHPSLVTNLAYMNFTDADLRVVSKGLFWEIRFSNAIVSVTLENPDYRVKMLSMAEALGHRQIAEIHARGCASIRIERISEKDE